MSINAPRWRHILMDFRADLRRIGINPGMVSAELLEPGGTSPEPIAPPRELRWLLNGDNMPAGWRYAATVRSHHDAHALLIERADG